MGRNTNGGLVITLNPLSVVATGDVEGVASVVGMALGEGDSLGVGEGDGEFCGASMVKFAHGLGATLAHSLWTPGASPANGLMCGALKFPFESAIAEPATLFGWSQ